MHVSLFVDVVAQQKNDVRTQTNLSHSLWIRSLFCSHCLFSILLVTRALLPVHISKHILIHKKQFAHTYTRKHATSRHVYVYWHTYIYFASTPTHIHYYALVKYLEIHNYYYWGLSKLFDRFYPLKANSFSCESLVMRLTDKELQMESKSLSSFLRLVFFNSEWNDQYLFISVLYIPKVNATNGKHQSSSF